MEYKQKHNFSVNLGTIKGKFKFFYDFNLNNNNEIIPCRLLVKWGNQVVDSGFRGSNSYNNDLLNLGFSPVLGNQGVGYITINKTSDFPTTVEVELQTPIEESFARVVVGCSDEPTEPGQCMTELYSWGNNIHGQVGNGFDDSSPPTPKHLIGTGFVKLSSGENHSHFLALKANGDLYAWGKNVKGELGNDSRSKSNFPIKIGEDYVEVSGGDMASFGIKTNGDLYGWGDCVGQYSLSWRPGQIYNSPTKIDEDYKKISAGEGFIFAIKSNGDLYTWWTRTFLEGANTHTPPEGSFANNFNNKLKVDEDVIAVTSGDGGALFLKSNGDLYLIRHDILFNPTIKTKLGEGYKVMAPGHGYISVVDDCWKELPLIQCKNPIAAAVKNNGELHVWWFRRDNLGSWDGDFEEEIMPGEDWSEVSQGENFTLALKTNGDLYGFGSNWASVGTPYASHFPIKIGEGYFSIATSDFTSYALKYNCNYQ